MKALIHGLVLTAVVGVLGMPDYAAADTPVPPPRSKPRRHVPEPATLSLAAVGVAALVVARRRQK